MAALVTQAPKTAVFINARNEVVHDLQNSSQNCRDVEDAERNRYNSPCVDV